MEREAVFRRLIHLSAPVFLLYYFIPSPLWAGGPPREVGLLAAFAVAMAFELARLVIGFKVPGMRKYEEEQISASAWSAVALTFAFLFFPLEMAAPVIFGMALVDPFISLVRRTKWYPWLPYALHLAIMLTVLSLLVQMDLRILIAAIITSVSAIAAEGIKTNYVDDDFLMIVVPLIALWLVLGL